MAAIYAADIYCNSCGNDIRKSITDSGLAPDDPDNESTYDSDEYPKFVGSLDETDSPQHCGSGEDCLEAETLSDGSKVGRLIGTNLTEAGVEYTREQIASGGLVAEFWADQFVHYLEG